MVVSHSCATVRTFIRIPGTTEKLGYTLLTQYRGLTGGSLEFAGCQMASGSLKDPLSRQ